ncbi:unnamed protein product [Dibothriocephalus latus]|uniref:E3 ubiquitin-protein ligase n=1 Tax=Dibothriocephalus latus TaxID=60516 RepID=A0A3P7LAS9_DIBLA|nr:unnamed protein product [Dibothriocephalus latus]
MHWGRQIGMSSRVALLLPFFLPVHCTGGMFGRRKKTPRTLLANVAYHMDERRMDLPFSESFLKLLTARQLAQDAVLESEESGKGEDSMASGVPGLKEFTEVYPEQGAFFQRCLTYLKYRRANIMTTEQVEQLEQNIFSAKLSDLYLTMEFPAICTTFGVNSFPLRDNYEWETLEGATTNANFVINEDCESPLITTENLETYIHRTVSFAMDKGIRRQMEAFKREFS